eukprot:scaffold42375_cov21-Tisochrysis_lutea.AAC.1
MKTGSQEAKKKTSSAAQWFGVGPEILQTTPTSLSKYLTAHHPLSLASSPPFSPLPLGEVFYETASKVGLAPGSLLQLCCDRSEQGNRPMSCLVDAHAF